MNRAVLSTPRDEWTTPRCSDALDQCCVSPRGDEANLKSSDDPINAAQSAERLLRHRSG